ncbi:MAG TPA: helix-turn-helix domain-containing protein [Ruminiclostridium sp.]|nr:helix-turn-helix domain-containing protein [Ruminiclostridium sp.]
MYKLLIADDEQIVIDSLKYIVNKSFPGEFTLESARSGRESIEKAEAFIPDIIFMDINMPGINGIDALAELRGKLPQCIFVIVTAFDQFDFAKDAIKLGVTEYLLKPVNREKIIETLQKGMNEIDRLRSKRKNELDLKEKLENILPVLESGFIYSMLFLEDNSMEMRNYKNIFEISEDGGYVMTIEFAQSKDSGHMVNRLGMSIKGQSFYPILRDIIKGKCRCFVGPVILNRIIVYVPSQTRKAEYESRLDAIDIAESIHNQSAGKINADFFIGIGRIYNGFDNIYRSYEESLMAIRYASEAGVLHIMDIPSGKGLPSEKYPVSVEKLLLEKAALGDTEACVQAFSHIFEWLQIEYYGSETKITSKLLELMILVSRLAYDHEIEVPGVNIDFISEFQNMHNISRQKLWCIQRLEFITKCISEAKQKNINSFILMATNYIKENYKKDITLEDISKEVNISPHYFSKLFKEEMGENFIDYLTNIRINKAKEIMKSSLLSIKEICYEIGYGDPNYFSRLFKKNAGMTPTEYRDRLPHFDKGGVSLNED